MLDAPSYLLGKKAGGGGSNLQSKSVEITENGTTNIRPDTGYDGLSKVDVMVTGILDTSDADAVSSDIAISKTAYVNGNKVTGNVPIGSSSVATNYSSNNVGIYLDDLQIDTEQRNTNQMFRSGDKISVYAPLSDVATTVGAVANKIKKDEVICGVTGTYEGGGGLPTAEENDVNFYDYDGTRVYSYTKNEFLALTEMPENPTHSGLTSQGWNWSLADAKDYVTNYGILDIGQLYNTDDGKIRIYFSLTEERKNPKIGFAVNGTATIEWGDGTSETVTGTSTTTPLEAQHTYSSGGNYVIKIGSSNRIFIIGNGSIGSLLLYDDSNGNAITNLYKSMLRKIELNDNVQLGTYAFWNLFNLEEMTFANKVRYSNNSSYIFANTRLKNVTLPINTDTYFAPGNYTFNSAQIKSMCLPKQLKIDAQNNFQYIDMLKRICLPSGLTTTLGGYFAQNAKCLNEIVIPEGITTFSNYCFANVSSLTRINMPSTLTTINMLAFNNDASIKYYDFSKHISVPTLNNVNVFQGNNSDYQIIVPDDLYETWKTTGNWSNSAVVDHIVKASEV